MSAEKNDGKDVIAGQVDVVVRPREACPICKQPMDYKGRGYSQDFGRDVDMYYCNQGCWTQKRIPVAV
ncbi:MAG: hypothetical protein QOH63_1957 [Acidobacteriota bacterium]|jgi:hypothetical protein|nr:hypothetical protein [Acidobacteriota bacterium]